MRPSLKFKIAALLPAVLIALLMTAGGARAQVGQTLVVDEQSEESHFPDSVDFRLRAHGFLAVSAGLTCRMAGDGVEKEYPVSVDEPAPNLDLRTSIDLSQDYILPGGELTCYWSLTSKSGETAKTPEKTFTLVDRRFDWKSLNDPVKQVTVHWYGVGDDFGKTLLATASGALGRIEQKLGLKLEKPANVWVYTKEDEFHEALPPGSYEWVGGIAFPDRALALVLITDPESVSVAEQINSGLPHELTHLALYQATDNPTGGLPRWLDEGLAMRNQEAHYIAQEYKPLRDAAHAGAVIPLSGLSEAFLSADADEAQLAYSESLSAVSFIMDDKRYGPDKMKKVIAALHGGASEEEGIKAGLGVSLKELDKEWEAGLGVEGGIADATPVAVDPKAAYTPTFFSGLLEFFFNPMVACGMLLAIVGVMGILERRRRAWRRRLAEEEGQG